MTQVSGRAGRADKTGQVVIQTYNPEHYAIQLACRQDYEQFFFYEMNLRHLNNYPPYYYTIKITVSAKSEAEAAKESFAIKRTRSMLESTSTSFRSNAKFDLKDQESVLLPISDKI